MGQWRPPSRSGARASRCSGPSLSVCCLFCLALAGLGLHCCTEAVSLQQAERRLGGCAQPGLRHAGSSWPRDRTRVSCIGRWVFLPLSCRGSPPPSFFLGVDSQSLFQRNFPTPELNPGLLHCRQILYQQSRQGSPSSFTHLVKRRGERPRGA